MHGNTDVYRQINDNEFLYVTVSIVRSKVPWKFDKEKVVSKLPLTD
jgi:lipopolysaccharide export system permease protein